MRSRPAKGKDTIQLSRRRFLTCLTSAPILGLSTSPAVALFTTILGGQSQKAWAAELGIKPRCLVLIHDGAGPACWMFDSFLTPYSSQGFNRNPLVATQFANVGGRYVGGEYVTHSLKGIEVPTMWTHNVPAPQGGTRPIANLLDNLLCFQGVDTRNAGHDKSVAWALLSPGAKQSSPALAGDALSTPFAALNLGTSNYVYKSTRSKSAVAPSMNGNALSNLLAPFSPVGSSPFQVKKSAVSAAYDGLFPMLDELSEQGHVGARALIENRNSALELVHTNFSGLTSEWNDRVAKYRDLGSRAIMERGLAGFNDRPIGEGGSGSASIYQMNGDVTYQLHLATDVRDAVVSATTITGLAERFALTEYVLQHKLSGSIAFSVGGLVGLIDPIAGGGNFSCGNDQHQTGLYPITYFNFLRYRAMAAMLLELIEQLKTAQLFNDTVIRWGGDFARNARADMTGADHGFTGAKYAHYCGAFNGPLIVGNLANDGRLGWGAGGTVPELNRRANLVDLAVLLAHLLGVQAPFTSETPVVTLTSNGLSSRIGLTRFV